VTSPERGLIESEKDLRGETGAHERGHLLGRQPVTLHEPGARRPRQFRQALADVPLFDGNYPILGSWLIGDFAAGMGIREDRTRITGDRSRFVPHAIV
jgi:hypothetical protein